MGQHEYEGRPKGNPMEMDFVEETTHLNYISKRVSVDEMRVGMLLVGLKSVGGWSAAPEAQDSEDEDQYEDLNSVVNGNSTTRKDKGRREIVGEKEIQEKIAHLRDCCRALLLMASYEEKRTKTLIQVVCHSFLAYPLFYFSFLFRSTR